MQVLFKLLTCVTLLFANQIAYSMDHAKSMLAKSTHYIRNFASENKLLTGVIVVAAILIVLPKITRFLSNNIRPFANDVGLAPENHAPAIRQRTYAGPILREGDRARVIGGTYPGPGDSVRDLIGKIAIIRGTTRQIWDIEDPYGAPLNKINNFALSNYLLSNPPDDGGLVYYGKVDSLGYCFHESWLRKVN